jgi:uncharacterized protein YdiU (UPF0061 family)
MPGATIQVRILRGTGHCRPSFVETGSSGCANGEHHEGERDAAGERMLKENPKFVPREWMLVEAYEAAAKGDLTVLHQLHDLFKDPYGEATADLSAKYYRTAPKVALSKGGTAFMS